MTAAASQGSIHYEKSSLVMYALKKSLGEETANRVRRRFLRVGQYQSPSRRNRRLRREERRGRRGPADALLANAPAPKRSAAAISSESERRPWPAGPAGSGSTAKPTRPGVAPVPSRPRSGGPARWRRRSGPRRRPRPRSGRCARRHRACIGAAADGSRADPAGARPRPPRGRRASGTRSRPAGSLQRQAGAQGHLGGEGKAVRVGPRH